MKKVSFFLSFCSLFLISSTNAQSYNLRRTPKSWHAKQIARACQTSEKISGIKRYALSNPYFDGATVGIFRENKDSKGWSSRAVVVLYAACRKNKGCLAYCRTIQRIRCPLKNKGSCTQRVRLLQVVDLLEQKTVVHPSAGSWFEGKLPQPKKAGRMPALLIQARNDRKFRGSHRANTMTVVLPLYQKGSLLPLFRKRTLELWPFVSSKQKARGIRMTTMTFRNPKGMSPELKTIKKGIPSPFNRCLCKRFDEVRLYRLATYPKRSAHIFRRVHML